MSMIWILRGLDEFGVIKQALLLVQH
jgi:hypothetical protein